MPHTVGKIIFTERGEHLLVSVSFMICCPLELEVPDKMIITIVLPYPNQKQNGTFTFQSFQMLERQQGFANDSD